MPRTQIDDFEEELADALKAIRKAEHVLAKIMKQLDMDAPEPDDESEDDD